MPNWCENKLRIEGKKEEIDKFLSVLKPDNVFWGHDSITTISGMMEYLDSLGIDSNVRASLRKKIDEQDANGLALLSSTFPIPDEVILAGYSDIGYKWCRDNWGTKWDVYIDLDKDTLYKDDEYIEMSFDSAWSPPVAWLKNIAPLYPELEFELAYMELGNMFAGVVKVKNDEVLLQIIAEDKFSINDLSIKYFEIEAFCDEDEDCE
jgi:hypothetical protein